jgi:S-adenosylmethionine:tRNA-ribosyltransferase-isomerase (queuine synthetase)
MSVRPREDVRLLVAQRPGGELEHARFRDLPELLAPGDLLVVNVSATLPAAVSAQYEPVRVHFSTRVPGHSDAWRVVELRTADGSEPLKALTGKRLTLDGGAELEVAAPYLGGSRLMVAHLSAPVEPYLHEHGEPIRYSHQRSPLPLAAYQNVYATTPGSSEMPSAGRPFTPELITRLIANGIALAPLTLHCGVSSPERHEPPFPEQFEVPEATARLVNESRRVIAVGTTVARALETVARGDGTVAPGAGWTNHVITPERGLRAVDGLITGWHEPDASHLGLLEAAVGRELLAKSYSAAREHGYLWHEFGDSELLLADRRELRKAHRHAARHHQHRADRVLDRVL